MEVPQGIRVLPERQASRAVTLASGLAVSCSCFHLLRRALDPVLRGTLSHLYCQYLTPCTVGRGGDSGRTCHTPRHADSPLPHSRGPLEPPLWQAEFVQFLTCVCQPKSALSVLPLAEVSGGGAGSPTPLDLHPFPGLVCSFSNAQMGKSSLSSPCAEALLFTFGCLLVVQREDREEGFLMPT